MTCCFDGLDTSRVRALGELERIVRSVAGNSAMVRAWSQQAGKATMAQVDIAIALAKRTAQRMEAGVVAKRSAFAKLDPSAAISPPVRVANCIYCPGDSEYPAMSARPDAEVVLSVGLAMNARGVVVSHQRIIDRLVVGASSWWWSAAAVFCFLCGLLAVLDPKVWETHSVGVLAGTCIFSALFIGVIVYAMVAGKLTFECLSAFNSWANYATTIPLPGGNSVFADDLTVLSDAESKDGLYACCWAAAFGVLLVLSYFFWAVLLKLLAFLVLVVLVYQSQKTLRVVAEVVSEVGPFRPYWNAYQTATVPGRFEGWVSVMDAQDRQGCEAFGLFVVLAKRLGLDGSRRKDALARMNAEALLREAVKM